jgi:hypothetical protein
MVLPTIEIKTNKAGAAKAVIIDGKDVTELISGEDDIKIEMGGSRVATVNLTLCCVLKVTEV